MDIRTLRNQVLSDLNSKRKFLSNRTYAALVFQFSRISDSKKKLNRFREEKLKSISSNTNTLSKIKSEKSFIRTQRLKMEQAIKDKKWQVLFYYTFYKPIDEENLRNQTEFQKNGRPKDIIFFNGKRYISTSYKNSDAAGSFELTKEFTKLAAFLTEGELRKKYEIVRCGEFQDEDSNIFRIASKFTGYDDFAGKLSNVIRSNPNAIVKMTGLEVLEKSNKKFDIDTEFAYAGGTTVPHVSMRDCYASIQLDKPFAYNEYIQNNHLPYSCWATLIINVWKESFAEWYKSINLTYEFLHEKFTGNSRPFFTASNENTNPDEILIGNRRPLKAERNGYSLEEVANFFKEYKLCLYVFDINMNILKVIEKYDKNGKKARIIK